MIKQGDEAPAFDLPTDSGPRVTLASLAGAPAVLFFYPKDDTSGCTSEAKDFTARAGAFADLGVSVIGVSPDSVASHARFRKKHDLAVRLASDEDKAMLQAFGVWVEKSMYGRKYMGVERTTVLLDAQGRVAQVWNKVKVPGHAEAVLTAARSLGGR